MLSTSSQSRPWRQRLAHRVLASALAGAGVLVAPAAWAQAAVASYDIPAGPLAQALTQYARSAGAVLSFDPSRLQGLSSPGLQGQYGVAEGFAQLLAGSGLQARRAADGVWTLEVAAPVHSTQTLAPIKVRGSNVNDPTQGYVATAILSATRTDTPLIEVPQSISVVTREQITEQGAQTLNQVLRYTAGVATETRGATATRLDQFTIRGFSASTYLDGMRVFGGRDALPQVDAYRLERVDVLKGPSSVMYGQGGPGGVVNQVSKRPTLERLNEIEVQAGNFDLRRVNMDFGGALSEDGTLLYRLSGAAYTSDGQLKHTKEKRYFVSPAFTWQPSAATSLTVLTNFQHDPDMGSYGANSAMRTVFSAPDGRKLKPNFYDGDANFEKSDRKSYSLGYVFDHRFNDTFKVSQSLRYQHAEGVYRSVYGAGTGVDFGYTGPDYRYLRRAAIATDVDVDAFTLDNNLQAQFDTGPLSHMMLVGFDYQHVRTDTLSGSGTAPALDVLRPNNRMHIPVPAFTSDQTSRQIQTGLYAQDQIKWDRLSLLLGGRYDWARTHSGTDNLARGTHSSSALSAEAFTGRAGLIYNLDNGLAPYISYSESFEPQSGTGWNNTTFKPIEGKQYEIGLKYEPPGADTLVTLSAFDLRRQNMLTTDPNPSHICGTGRCSVQAGEVRTKGIELEAKSEPIRGLAVTAAYTYLDNKYSKANANAVGFNLKGKGLAGVPEHNASVWARYQLQSGPMAGTGVGAGVRYLGSTWGNSGNTFKVPSATLVDLMIDYDLGRLTTSLKGMQVALNVSNLFNKDYVASCLDETWCWFGYQRTVKASLRYRW